MLGTCTMEFLLAVTSQATRLTYAKYKLYMAVKEKHCSGEKKTAKKTIRKYCT